MPAIKIYRTKEEKNAVCTTYASAPCLEWCICDLHRKHKITYLKECELLSERTNEADGMEGSG